MRSVEVLSTQGRAPSVSLPAAAKALTAAAAAATGGSAGSSTPGDAGDSKASSSDTAAATAAPAGAAEAAAGSGTGPSYAAAVSAAADAAAAAAAAAGASAAAAGSVPEQWLQPPPGTTELPTCPVCLERLDEHISGIVTTVRVDHATCSSVCRPLALRQQCFWWPAAGTTMCVVELQAHLPACRQVRLAAEHTRAMCLCVCLVPAGVQPPLPRRVHQALGRHLLPRLPLLHAQQQRQHQQMQHVWRQHQPVDMPDMRARRLRQVGAGAAAARLLVCGPRSSRNRGVASVVSTRMSQQAPATLFTCCSRLRACPVLCLCRALAGVQVQAGPCQRPLEVVGTLLRPGAGDTARLGLCRCALPVCGCAAELNCLCAGRGGLA